MVFVDICLHFSHLVVCGEVCDSHAVLCGSLDSFYEYTFARIRSKTHQAM